MNDSLILLGALSVAACAGALGSCSTEVNKPQRRNVESVAAPQSMGADPQASLEPATREQFVGSAVCVSCHRAQGDAYSNSHHAKALVATGTDAGRAHLDGARHKTQHGGITRFTVQDNAVLVNTPVGKDRAKDLNVPYVAGVWPLQQYIVETERGKLQTLGVSWDSRSQADGGSRWFHIYGPSGIAPGDPLFFTSVTQNWNHMCADCHSTWVERRYDVDADRFDTRWAELSVGCEACHGPGAEHVRSARDDPENVVGLAARLQRSAAWVPSATGSPTPRVQSGIEVNTCAPCHSRRSPLAEGFTASDAFLDHFEPELLWPGRYHADGQVEGEVYEWGSFLQSRMYQAGVTCSDCHEPHSGELRGAGDALCVSCHEPTRFGSASHSHHAGPTAPRCIDCHMPPATFMQIDERRDHSIRIPRPDHSVEFGTPNACNGCHSKESAAWAREWTRKWFPTLEQRRHFVEALGKDRKGAADASFELDKLALEAGAPAIARATALERLGDYPSDKTLATLRKALAAAEALVVYGAVLGATRVPLDERVSLLLPLLEHDALAVRIAAGKALAAAPVNELPANAQAALQRVFSEIEESSKLSASRAEIHVEQSAFELSRGKLDAAEAALKRAIRIEPCLVEALLNWAELERRRGAEPEAERAIRRALGCEPDSASAHHALGLWLVRAKQPVLGRQSLERAVMLDPSDVRFSYVLAVALASAGATDQAVRVLEASLANHPNHIGSLQALSRYLTELGQVERAAELRRRFELLLALDR